MSKYKHQEKQLAREQAFFFLFEKIFNDADFNDIIESAMLARDIQTTDYAKKVFYGVDTHLEQIDSIIQTNSLKWEKDRLPKVSLAVLRLAVYEILYEDDIPPEVSINEAVELVKMYATQKDASFVNGVLSGFYKSLKKDIEPINGDTIQ